MTTKYGWSLNTLQNPACVHICCRWIREYVNVNMWIGVMFGYLDLWLWIPLFVLLLSYSIGTGALGSQLQSSSTMLYSNNNIIMNITIILTMESMSLYLSSSLYIHYTYIYNLQYIYIAYTLHIQWYNTGTFRHIGREEEFLTDLGDAGKSKAKSKPKSKSKFKGLLLYTAIVLFHAGWCIRQLWSSSIIIYTSLA